MKLLDNPAAGHFQALEPGHSSPGRLEKLLRAGQFAVTAELSPPDSTDPEEIFRTARIFDGAVDAINATDGSGGNCHMSSVAVCALLGARTTPSSCRCPAGTGTGLRSRET